MMPNMQQVSCECLSIESSQILPILQYIGAIIDMASYSENAKK
jgi:hypothetical protein